MNYKKVLIALDFADDYKHILEAGKSIVKDTTEIHLISVIRPMVGYYGGGIEGMNSQTAVLEQEVRDQTKKRLDELGEELGLPAEQLHLEFGQPAGCVRAVAEDLKVDAIVIGTHGRHGLGLLLGSTASGVLHGVPCDTLVVRV